MIDNNVHHIEIPSDSNYFREYRTTKINRGTTPLSKEDYLQYDKTTLFHDIFFTPSNKTIVVIGPPLLNLSNFYTPIYVSVNNKRYPLKYKEYIKNRILIGKIRVPKKLPDICKIEIEFGNQFKWSGEIKKSKTPRINKILCAMQKDNKAEWIRDWAKHYHTKYGIKNIVVYDNNSSNIKEIMLLTKELDYLTIIPWKSLYGTYRSHGNQFSQTGALNHCRLKFAPNAKFFNFDIDELLLIPINKLENRLKWAKTVKFGQYYVPSKDEIMTKPYTFSDFNTRLIPGTMFNQKYVCNSSKILVNHIHKNQHAPLNIITTIDKIIFRLAKKLKLPNFLMSKLPYQEVPLNEGFFLHYKGINTGWSPGLQPPSGKEELFNPF